MWGGFGSSARAVSVHSAEALGARSAAGLRRRAGAGIGAGAVAVAMLSAMVPSSAQASDKPDNRPTPGAWFEAVAPAIESDESKPEPLDPTPPPHKTPPPHPTQKPKPKPKPTPRAQIPSNPASGEQVPGEPGQGPQSPGDPNSVRPDEPPAAPGNPMPGSAGGQPPAEPGTTYVEPPSPGATAHTGAGAPLPYGLGPPASRVQLLVAAATVSGIAAVAGWLVVGGRRPERVPLQRPWATTVTLADDVKLDFELVRRGPERSPDARYAGRVPPAATPTLWRSEDDRPRWLRRLNDQVPPRASAAGSSVGLDDDEMPWLSAVAWPYLDDRDEDPRAQ